MMPAEHSVHEQPILQHANNYLEVAPLRSSATELEEQARAFIRQRPVVAVLAALGAGYLVARVIARGRAWRHE